VGKPDRLGVHPFISAWNVNVPADSKLLESSRFCQIFYRGIAVMLLEIRQIAGSALTDERHGNICLNNEQHLFTAAEMPEIVRKKPGKPLEEGVNCVFCYVETSGKME
jgi:hypothetical protein